jgi:hypothetical protein
MKEFIFNYEVNGHGLSMNGHIEIIRKAKADLGYYGWLFILKAAIFNYLKHLSKLSQISPSQTPIETLKLASLSTTLIKSFSEGLSWRWS